MKSRQKLIVLAVASAFTSQALAVGEPSYTWNCAGTDFWDTATCWTPNGPPAGNFPGVNNANVYVGSIASATADSTLVIDSVTGTASGRYLTNDSTGGYLLTMYQTGGALNIANNETIGFNGVGAYTQSGGTHTVGASLMLGQRSGSIGSYTLSGSGSLSVINAFGANEYIGYSGTGTFTQSGGTHTVNSLALGVNGGSIGTYTLSGGTLTVGSFANGAGSGTFNLDGGTLNLTGNSVDVDYFNVGNAAGSSGSFTLVSGMSLTAADENMGNFGTSNFTQSGGTHTVGNALFLGYYGGSSGSYAQSGGTHTVGNSLVLGYIGGSNGNYTLSGTGSLSANNEFIGFAGTGSFIQSSGTHVVGNTLYLGHSSGGSGSYTLSGGTLTVSDIADGAGTGTFNLDGGTLNVTGNSIVLDRFNIGKASGSNASFTLASGKTLTINESLDNGSFFELAGGTITGGGTVINNGQFSGHGSITGTAGVVNVGNLVQSGGTLAFSNTGGVVNQGYLEVQAGNQLVLDGTSLQNSGNFNLNGGRLTGTGTLNNQAAGSVTGRGTISTGFSNAGTLAVESGLTTITRPFANSGIVQLASNSATLAGGEVTNTGRIEGRGKINNAILNLGVVEASGGTLTLNGLVTNNKSGALVAGAGNTLYMLSGMKQNQGMIQLNGGTFDNRNAGLAQQGQIQASAGNSVIRGDVSGQNGSRIIVSGGGSLTFYDTVDIQKGAELRVSEGSVAVYFGQVYQRTDSLFSGKGTNYFEGKLDVGNSPGRGAFEGNVTFGSLNTYEAEIGGIVPATGYDYTTVGGLLTFGGTLKLESYGSFVAQAGQTFDLFDWGTTRGTFANIDSSSFLLATGTRLDTSKLYVDGSISVAAVPEPESYLMFLAGLGLMGFIARQRRMHA